MGQAIPTHEDICTLLALRKQGVHADDMSVEARLAVVALTLQAEFGRDCPVQIRGRRVEDEHSPLLTARAWKNIQVLSVNDQLYDLDGPTDWDRLRDAHNASQSQAYPWREDQEDIIEGNFSDVFWRAGFSSTKIFEAADQLRSAYQAWKMEHATDLSSGVRRGPRI